jgi:hypothetical protein
VLLVEVMGQQEGEEMEIMGEGVAGMVIAAMSRKKTILQVSLF